MTSLSFYLCLVHIAWHLRKHVTAARHDATATFRVRYAGSTIRSLRCYDADTAIDQSEKKKKPYSLFFDWSVALQRRTQWLHCRSRMRLQSTIYSLMECIVPRVAFDWRTGYTASEWCVYPRYKCLTSRTMLNAIHDFMGKVTAACVGHLCPTTRGAIRPSIVQVYWTNYGPTMQKMIVCVHSPERLHNCTTVTYLFSRLVDQCHKIQFKQKNL